MNLIQRSAIILVALVLINLIGAAISVAIIWPAWKWLEFFAAAGYEDVATLGAFLLVIGGLVAVIVSIIRLEEWWRARKLQRLSL